MDMKTDRQTTEPVMRVQNYKAEWGSLTGKGLLFLLEEKGVASQDCIQAVSDSWVSGEGMWDSEEREELGKGNTFS